MPAKKSKSTKKEEVKEESTPEKEEVKEESTPDDTVSVKREDLDSILNRLEKKDKEIEMLIASADKAKFAKARADVEGRQQIIPKVRIWRFGDENKIVVGTKMTANQSEVINGRLIEDQRLMVIYEDGKTEEVSLIGFHRNVKRDEKGEVIGRSSETNKDGSQDDILTIKLEDGQELKISSKYIN